ncbi:hypothetical protein C0992_000944 [Termitomyces sp. T32_za158]|nr:hypothetical protein C0992_000944 [Termitomyces sp. T32_za158]
MATYTQTCYQTAAYGRPVPNPEYPMGIPQPLYPLCPLTPIHNLDTGVTNMQDHFTAPPSVKDLQSTGAWVPPITHTTLKYFPVDSLRPHPTIGTHSSCSFGTSRSTLQSAGFALSISSMVWFHCLRSRKELNEALEKMSSKLCRWLETVSWKAWGWAFAANAWANCWDVVWLAWISSGEGGVCKIMA